jgi:hypothetical protein
MLPPRVVRFTTLASPTTVEATDTPSQHDLCSAFIRMYSVALILRVDSGHTVQEERNYGHVALSREGGEHVVNRFAVLIARGLIWCFARRCKLLCPYHILLPLVCSGVRLSSTTAVHRRKSGAMLSVCSIACNATHELPSKIVLCIKGRYHFTTSVGEPGEILSRH